jgi:hypothetical protein
LNGEAIVIENTDVVLRFWITSLGSDAIVFKGASAIRANS